MPECPERRVSILLQVSDHSQSKYSSSRIPIYQSAECTVAATSRGERIDAVAIPISDFWAVGHTLANGRPCRRRRRRRRCHYRQARRSLRGSHVNVRRAAGKRVRRVSGVARREVQARRHAPEGRERRGSKCCGRLDGVEGHEDPRRAREGGGESTPRYWSIVYHQCLLCRG